MEGQEGDNAVAERRPKIRRLSRKILPDTLDTDSCPEVDPAVFQLELKNKALQKQIQELEKMLAKERAEGDLLRSQVADQATRLDFCFRTVQELGKSVAAFGGALLLHAPPAAVPSLE
ncbi:unnamed protein product [Symbiodinium sp. CCMP2592]|nr:unnamed protein product [Symbiodinium sp. CCMP2592]CAE7784006.1 unnamed protein product [Symbiodinium sp. CCMP2592]